MSHESDRVEARYVGPYGRGHSRAYVSGVGELYYGEIVEITRRQFNRLPPEEWQLVANNCRHVSMGGDVCWEERDGDSLYCTLHLREFQNRAQLMGDKRHGSGTTA